MRTLPALLASLFFVLTAGCLADGGDGDDPIDPGTGSSDPPAGSDPTVHDGSGSVQAGAGTPVISFVNGAGGAEFSVPANTTLMFIEMAWVSDVTALDLCVHAPADGANEAGVPICGEVVDGGGPGTPTNLVTYTRSAPETGAGWTASPYLDGPAAQQDYVLKVTLFYGETAVPDGYSALS